MSTSGRNWNHRIAIVEDDPVVREHFIEIVSDQDGLDLTVVVGVARVIDSTEDRRGRFRQRLRFEQLRVVDRDDLAGWVFRKQVKPR